MDPLGKVLLVPAGLDNTVVKEAVQKATATEVDATAAAAALRSVDKPAEDGRSERFKAAYARQKEAHKEKEFLEFYEEKEATKGEFYAIVYAEERVKGRPPVFAETQADIQTAKP